ncbi:hypothetical protein [Pseudoclavibacter sp. RFBB5]|uniref:hypothetical protein n=1 Tax=Pseudoclavibacter sp. RFBB5 TaxID=2080574 RepID=UPI000CE7AD32|nr:hypothetical protein [Pseudoclavibacter sp. RFBB5]PPG27076.1 hypothetical protein C5B97_16725 [Pseudoclavibacter sp. RFBB5]
MSIRAFRSQRFPITHRSPEEVWRAATPFGTATLVYSADPWRATASGDGLPTAELIADETHHRGAAWVAPEGAFRFPMQLVVGGIAGEVTQPHARRFDLQLTRRSRTVRARIGGVDGTEWTMRGVGLSSVQVSRNGAPVVTSGASFTSHRLEGGCTPQDLAVAIALSPLRATLFVLTSLA